MNQDAWIKTSPSSLPDLGRAVWAWIKTQDTSFGSECELSHDGSWYEEDGSMVFGEVTHWQPLPDRPVENTKEPKCLWRVEVAQNHEWLGRQLHNMRQEGWSPQFITEDGRGYGRYTVVYFPMNGNPILK